MRLAAQGANSPSVNPGAGINREPYSQEERDAPYDLGVRKSSRTPVLGIASALLHYRAVMEAERGKLSTDRPEAGPLIKSERER